MSDVTVTEDGSTVTINVSEAVVNVGTPAIVSASAVPFTPTGGIAAANVQAALAELDAEKQPLDAELTALAALTSAADQLPYFTGSGTAALTTLTAFGRSLIAAADAPAAKVALGLGLLASTVSGNTATLAGALTGARAYTLPDASLTFAGQNIDNAFSVAQTIVAATGLTTRPAAGQDGLRIQGRAAGTLGYTLALTTVAALSANATVYLPTVDGATVIATTSTPAAGQIPYSAGTNYTATLGADFHFDSPTQTLRVGVVTGTQNPSLRLAAGLSGTGVSTVQMGTDTRDWKIRATGSPYNLVIDYVGSDAPVSNILSLTKAGAATFIGAVTVPNGTAAAPGIRTTTYAHGLFSADANNFGWAVGGVLGGYLNVDGLSVGGAGLHSLRLSGAVEITSSNECRIMRTKGNVGDDIYPSSAGNLVLMPRTSASRDVSFWTGMTTPAERLRVAGSGVVTVFGTADGILVVNGKITAKAAVPGSFADLAAVRTYLASILT